PVQEVDRAGPRRREAHPHLPGPLRVPARHERRHLLVASLHELDLAGVAVERAEGGVDPVARVAVDPLDPPLGEPIEHEIGGGGCHLRLDPPRCVPLAAIVCAAAAAAEDELGPIDVWINDAMATVFAPFAEIEPAEFRRSTEVTYLGAVWGTKAALRRMVPRDRGTVVQVGSALAFRGIPLQAP